MADTHCAEPERIDLEVLTQRYYEDAVHDGDVEYHRTETELVEDLTIGECINLIRGLGLVFGSADAAWATDPDGARCIDFATGENESTTVFVKDADSVPGYALAAIKAGVDSNQALSAANRACFGTGERAPSVSGTRYCHSGDHDGAAVPATRHTLATRSPSELIEARRCDYCAEGEVASLVREGWRVTVWQEADESAVAKAADL